jgi:hypothetical protein
VSSLWIERREHEILPLEHHVQRRLPAGSGAKCRPRSGAFRVDRRVAETRRECISLGDYLRVGAHAEPGVGCGPGSRLLDLALSFRRSGEAVENLELVGRVFVPASVRTSGIERGAFACAARVLDRKRACRRVKVRPQRR